MSIFEGNNYVRMTKIGTGASVSIVFTARFNKTNSWFAGSYRVRWAGIDANITSRQYMQITNGFRIRSPEGASEETLSTVNITSGDAPTVTGVFDRTNPSYDQLTVTVAGSSDQKVATIELIYYGTIQSLT